MRAMDSEGEVESIPSDGFITRSENESESDQDEDAASFTSLSSFCRTERKRKNFRGHGKPIKSVKTDEEEDGTVCVKQEEDEEPVEKEVEKSEESQRGKCNVQIIEMENSGTDPVSETNWNEPISEKTNNDDEQRTSLTPSHTDASPISPRHGCVPSTNPSPPRPSRLRRSFPPHDDVQGFASALADIALEKHKAELQKGIDELDSLRKEIDQKIKEYQTGCALIRAKVEDVAKTCTESIADKVNKEVISCLSDALQIPNLAVFENRLKEEDETA